jgi:hypothetical protein
MMAMVMRRSIEEIKESYYEKGISGELPESWEDYKKWVVEKCTGDCLLQSSLNFLISR